jgi:hypothetical protein
MADTTVDAFDPTAPGALLPGAFTIDQSNDSPGGQDTVLSVT